MGHIRHGGIIAASDPAGVVSSQVDVAMFIGDAGDAAADRVLGAAIGVLDALQTELAEETSEPWPDRGGAKSYAELPYPGVKIVGAELRTWYGPPAEPIVAFRPIALADILRDSA